MKIVPLPTEKCVQVRGIPFNTPTGKVRVKRKIATGQALPVGAMTHEILGDDYIEWQISYDTESLIEQNVVKEVEITKDDGQVKYGCELIKLLVDSLSVELLSSVDIRSMIEFAEHAKGQTVEEAEVILREPAPSKIASPLEQEGFARFQLKTPQYVKQTETYGIEVKLGGKQKAVGIQAMIYVWLPMRRIESSHGGSLIGRSAVHGEDGIYAIERDNVALVGDTVRAFALASERHRLDILQLLNGVIQNAAR